ncbi:hypothetical protein MMJ63_22350, partial [Bacillus vallismortis]|nr:hypothetical protein [Bacillus vallismortis]
ASGRMVISFGRERDMDFMNKKPTDADRFMQRVTRQHSSTSLFSNAHLDTSKMTPELLAAFKEK